MWRSTKPGARKFPPRSIASIDGSMRVGSSAIFPSRTTTSTSSRIASGKIIRALVKIIACHSERSRGIPQRKLKGSAPGSPPFPGSSIRMTDAPSRKLPFPARARIIFSSMDYDVAIIGGAFSGAATAVVLKRRCPNARVLIIEKTTEFDRKVGESTTEVSSCYMMRILGLIHHLGHHHLPKQGLRLWFSQHPDQSFDDCAELGARYGARLAGFQVDRATLDTHLLEKAVAAGCELMRPAKVTALELHESGEQVVTLDFQNQQRIIQARWIVDASGRAAMIARKLGHCRPNLDNPINAVWARFTWVKEWDSYEWREKFPEMANACRTSREWATNHLMGYGWWCWIIPLRGGDVSAGIVYDSRIFDLPAGATLAQRLHNHLVSHPVGPAFFGEAQAIEGDVHAFSALPYW